MGKKILYLVRHGQAAYTDSAANLPKDMHGYLTDLGQEQARLTAQRLAQLPITTIYHSDLQRATQTATAIAAELPHVSLCSTPLLRECIPCLPSRPITRKIDFDPEVIAENQNRVEQVFTQYFAQSEADSDQHEALVCHGNIIRYLICRSLQVEPQAWINADTHNCGISEVSVENNKTLLVSYNDTGHLPYSMRTFL